MWSRARHRVMAVLLLCATVASFDAVAAAQSNSSKTIAYRWVDENGVVHYGDRIPPQYSQDERTILNAEGVQIGKVGAAKSAAQLEAEAQAREAELKQKQHDAFLLTTYTSVKDIEALRDQRLEQLHGQRNAAEQYVDNLHSRLSSLQVRALNFKPYSAKPDARRMPDDLAEDLVRTLNELETQKGVLSTKGDEEVTLRAQFQADIERYQELKRPVPEP